MEQTLSSDQFKARRNSFFQKKMKTLHGANISNISATDELVCRTFSVKKGDFLYQEGESCKALYIVRSGSLKTFKQNPAGLTQVVGFHLVGELVGFDGFATGYHDCTAQFLEAASVSELSLDVLDEHCRDTPAVQKKLFSSVSLEINRDHELLFLLGRMTAEEKLAAFLLNLSSRMKQHLWKETEFNLSMARYDIANYLGLAVETTSRLFALFRERGLIDINKRHIKINDMKRLKMIINTSGETDEQQVSGAYCTTAA
jgi:CRP/FNR family transcriptional regulator